jgi:gamma-glutamylputrescine oxidase
MFGLRFPTNTSQHTRSYYAATTDAGEGYEKLVGAIESDIAVVGGGFSGVNTALELAERGYSVVLLEANRLCWGASGRNGGQIIGGIGHNPAQFRRTIGDEGVLSIKEMGLECVDIIRERVAKYDIDCDLRWGYCDVALKPRHMRDLEKSFREEERPHSLTLLDKTELKKYVGSDAYIGGLYDASGAGHVDPMKLCLGEAAAAVQLGTQLFEHSKVTKITPGERVTLHTETGSVNAKHAVFCGNAYMENLIPKLASRVLPASSCVIATESLSDELAHSILPMDVAACDPRTALDYYRRTADNRLLFGGLSNYTGLVPNNYEAVMQHKMLQIFPQLGDTKIEFAWDGQMGIGLNRMPQVGKVAENTYFMQAYSGHGVAPTHIMARITAEAIDGETRRHDLMSKIRHWPFPGGRYLRRPGLAVGMLYFKALDLF